MVQLRSVLLLALVVLVVSRTVQDPLLPQVLVAKPPCPKVTVAEVTINGIGATFPQPLYQQYGSDWATQSSGSLAYTGSGSGDGRAKLNAAVPPEAYDFFASDVPLTPTERSTLTKAYGDPVHFPAALGGVSVSYNVSGVTSLNLDKTTLARIFNGSITQWNDQAIKSLNPQASLPAAQINLCVRSDSSGTTTVFTSFLYTAGFPLWSTLWGTNTPAGASLQQGSGGVAACLKSTANSLGYISTGYLSSSQDAFVKNAAGSFLKPNASTILVAATNPVGVDWSALDGTSDFSVVNCVNSAAVGAYPIVTYSYILFFKNISAFYGTDTTSPSAPNQRASALLGFLSYINSNPQNSLIAGNQYVSLPNKVQKLNRNTLQWYDDDDTLTPCGTNGKKY